MPSSLGKTRVRIAAIVPVEHARELARIAAAGDRSVAAELRRLVRGRVNAATGDDAPVAGADTPIVAERRDPS